MLKNLKKYNVNVMNEDLGKRTKDLVVAPKIFSVSKVARRSLTFRCFYFVSMVYMMIIILNIGT